MRTLLLVFLFGIVALSARLATASEPSESFDLEVRLQSPYNTDFSVVTLVRFDEPFAVRASNGDTTNTFWGELHPAKAGKYQLELAICEWKSPRSYTCDLSPGLHEMELGVSEGWGLISSLVYGRTVTLCRHKAK